MKARERGDKMKAREGERGDKVKAREGERGQRGDIR